ncbi:hypothetical protein FI667_g7650, partial [Globisporangium splendens]
MASLKTDSELLLGNSTESLTLPDLTFFHALTTASSNPKSHMKRARPFAAERESDDDGRTSDDSHSSATTTTPLLVAVTSPWSSSDSGNGVVVPRTPSPVAVIPRAKHRKRSYEMNREAKEKLQEELWYLEARVALLKHEAGMVAPQVIESKRALGGELRDAVLQQHLTLATAQSMFSDLTNCRATSPLESYIHLTTDWQQRRSLLLAMKDRKIDAAHRFLLERTRFMNPFQECSEQSRYVTEDGDLCTIKMDVTPFEGVASVRQVFNAMQFYLMNLEITLTEMSGNVTVRENDENDETTVLQHRLVTSERGGVLVEKNTVLFLDTSGLDCDNVDDQSAMITVDFVDRDDLYPYCPSQRLRKDATSVMKLSAHRRKRNRVVPSGTGGEVTEEDAEFVVVLTRWFLVRVRRPEIAVSESIVRSIAEDLTGGVDLMIKSMREGVYPTSPGGQ